MNFRIFLFLLLGVGAFSANVLAKERCLEYTCFKESSQFAHEKEEEGALPFQLVSAVRYRFWGFSVYTIGLYQRELRRDWENAPLILELHYHRTLQPEDFLKTSRKLLGKNDEYLRIGSEKPLLEFSKLITQVGDGDSYALHYSPDGTLSLYFNGRKRGSVRHKEFARAYIGMWLGEYAVKSDNRDRLLGGQFVG